MSPRRLAAIRVFLGRALLVGLGVAAGAGARPAAADGVAPAPAVAPAPGLHPDVVLRDAAGQPLAAAGPADSAVSAAATCGACHDAAFIAARDSHGTAARTPEGRAALRALAPDCIGCHVPGGAEGLLAAARTPEGAVRVAPGDPTPGACGQCHGFVADAAATLAFDDGYLRAAPHGPYAQTLRTGEVFSPQPAAASFLNLAEKAAQTRPWDIHAARGLTCTDCHVSPNNPAHGALRLAKKLPHLRRDPRAPSLGAYLKAPDHRLVTADCRSCHDPAATHRDLPARERHLAALACQACHVPRLLAPTPRAVDATVVTAAGGPRLELRGVSERPFPAPSTWLSEGYRPFLLPEPAPADGAAGGADAGSGAGDGVAPSAGTRLAPYNLIARWEWVDEAAAAPGPDLPRPAVAADILRGAWQTADGAYRPELVAALDRDGDGRLADAELVLDSDARVAAVAARLRALGVAQPAIRATLTAWPVRHGVVDGPGATADCRSCHSGGSRIGEEVFLSASLPGGVPPAPDVRTARLLGERRPEARADGLVLPRSAAAGERYVLGLSRPWSDYAGLFVFAATLLGVLGHGGLRVVSARRARRTGGAAGLGHGPRATERVYMYGTYERVWHWLMATSVLVLLLTGLSIHFPDGFAILPYATAVFLHNVAAGVFTANAFLSLFYNVASSEIRQFIPQRAGFVPRVLLQVRYYLKGIFERAAHPLAKTPSNKLNPLQQVAYFGLLNVLFPLQIATGALLWAAGRWPALVEPLGGLTVLGPLHNLGSWLFLAFLVMHVYLTTTGHTPTSNLKAMIDGWEEVEVAPTGAAGARPVAAQTVAARPVAARPVTIEGGSR
jgi:thiosulfate reductase cytochrome b subunit